VTPGRRRRVDSIPDRQTAIVGVNIRTLRLRKGWSQAKLALARQRCTSRSGRYSKFAIILIS
jgi:hypothetical protein